MNARLTNRVALATGGARGIGAATAMRLAAGGAAARAMQEYVTTRTPVGRVVRSEEVAGVIAFLAGDDASYVTGSEVYVDGGWTAW